MADSESTGQNQLSVDISLSNDQVSENSDGATVGFFSFHFPPQIGTTQGGIWLSGPDAGLFEVVDDRLKLTNGYRANYEKQSLYHIAVSAYDSGGYLKIQEIVIGVTDLNEQATEILLVDNEVEENRTGVVVGDLSVVDPDSNETHSLSLSLMKHGELFEIVNGQLKLKDQISADYDDGQPYTVFVVATDSAGSTFGQWLKVFVTQAADSIELVHERGPVQSEDFLGFSGISTLNGGDGIDRVTYDVIREAVRFDLDSEGYLTIEKRFEDAWPSGSQSVDQNQVNTLLGIERLVFSDQSFALDIDGNAGIAAKIIISAFGTETVNKFLSAGLSLVDEGLSQDDLSRLIIDNQLMESINGVTDDRTFVDFVFNNVVGRMPEMAEQTLLTGHLDSGRYTRSSFLTAAAGLELVDNQLIHQAIDLIGVPGTTDGEWLALSYLSG
jgi:hypothetical protein